MNNTGMAIGPQAFCKGIEKMTSADVDFIRLSSVWYVAKSKSSTAKRWGGGGAKQAKKALVSTLLPSMLLPIPSSQLSLETKWPCRQGLLPLNIS